MNLVRIHLKVKKQAIALLKKNLTLQLGPSSAMPKRKAQSDGDAGGVKKRRVTTTFSLDQCIYGCECMCNITGFITH